MHPLGQWLGVHGHRVDIPDVDWQNIHEPAQTVGTPDVGVALLSPMPHRYVTGGQEGRSPVLAICFNGP